MFEVELIGNLGYDASVFSEQGPKFGKFRVAVSKRKKDAAGIYQSETVWIDCLIRPESPLIPFLKKGCQVFVRGNANLSTYVAKSDNQVKPSLSVWATEVILLAKSKNESM